ncbi:FHS family L-fucose permease-like MFS transporter [Aquimarina sp. EL_43]|uniref:sugar MFS transporter n=1 Tax=unclassified Aquimarina TaxID=2627091 RepID=UPI0018CA407F|nr:MULTISPECIES: sugar MFS transporter [unclassified Aquimarina]MBG6133592.1 FHS family L-fucose permease-like MFS transporter [Aquimarina sp. EL_35]MBG6153810.1 FHS family L-fucose permease-like MFS transporter [Aquimarina sp. EL_32]MBG6171956.1 FHS family L-fucose permease-like MFS transporter [Aquimarina sp. EL_43]
MKNSTTYKSAFIFLTSLFFLWGFITVLVDSLIPRLREVFTLNYFQAGLVQFAFFGAYFLLSIPSGFILSKIGYKKGIILGLLTLATGCLLFYPAASYREFSIFMLAYFVVASGITILQVAANPYVAVLGSEEGASSRLNLSQAFNSLGTTIAPAIGAMFILSDKVKNPQEIAALNTIDKESYYISEAAAVQSPFIGIAIFVAILAFIFIFIKLPKLIKSSPKGGYIKVLQSRSLMMGAIGIFVYVGAEVAIGSYLINYFLDMNLASRIKESTFMRSISEGILGSDSQTLDNKAIVGAFVTFYWSGAMIGRFIGAHLTKIIKPAKVLSFFAIGAILLILISMSTSGFIAMWSILAVGLFNSIMFPTIFSLSIEGLDDLKPQASGVLCTMIVGGAIIPPLFGLLSDQTGFKTALTLVLICYIYIVFYGRRKANI